MFDKLVATRSLERDGKPDVVHILGSLDGGGAERFVRELVPCLIDRGVRTEIVCNYAPRIDGEELAALRAPVHYRKKNSGFDPRHVAWLIALLRQRRPLLVNTHQWAGKYEGRIAALAAGVPIIVHTEHSSLPMSRNERFMSELLWRRTDAVVTFSKAIIELIRAREPVKLIELIPNGVYIPPLPPTREQRASARVRIGAPDETVVFGSVASLRANKNHELAIEAISKISPAETPAVRLDIFGEGPWKAQLVRKVRELDVADRVVFHGFRGDVRELLPALDVFLTLSKMELAPISMLEAMARSLPIIGAPHAGTLEMVDPDCTGAIVDWKVETVSAAMRIARDDPQWRLRCGGNGRARAIKDYDIELVADRYAALYARLHDAKNGVKHVPATTHGDGFEPGCTATSGH